MKTNKFFLVIAITTVMMVACSEKKSGGPTIKEANNLFSEGSYTEALDVYLELIPEQGSPARVGAGWCYLRLNQLSDANAQFVTAASDSIVDGYAGWSFTSWALDQPSLALEKANVVLIKQPDFILSLDTKIKAEHLIWVQAASYLQLQNYPACLQKIQILAPSFSPDLNDPNIEDALLVKLEELGSAS
jgi:hypothetical protein